MAGSGADGSAQFDAATCAVDSQARLLSAPFDLRLPGVRHLLRFRFYHDASLPDYSDYLQVAVSTDPGGPFTPLGDPILRTGGPTGWKSYTFDLSTDPALRAQPAVYISFVGVSQNGANLRIDDVTHDYQINPCVWTAQSGMNDFADAANWECGESPSRAYWQIIPDRALAPVASTPVDVGGLLLQPHAQMTVTGDADLAVSELALSTGAGSTFLMGRGAVTSTAMTNVEGRLDLRQSGSVHLRDVKIGPSGELLPPPLVQITGDLDNRGRFTAGAGTVVLAGVGHQRLAGTLTLHNLLISSGVTLTVAGPLTITGQLTNLGWLLEARTFITGQPIHQDFALTHLTLDVATGHALTDVTGDVNANGVRNSADALLILKYDVGLLQGDDNFPPAPGKLYLPRCDVVLDGKCNSSDALRILQCDIRLPNVTCDSATAARVAPDSTSTVVLFAGELTSTVATAGDAVVLTVHTVDAAAALAATSLRLTYDPAAWQVSDCVSNPTGMLNGGVCNRSEAGVVRFNSVAVQGVPATTPLAQITFRPLQTADVTTLASQLTLTAEQAFDQQGVALAWQSAISGPVAVVPTPPVAAPVATPEVALLAGYQLYLPVIHQGQVSAQAQTVVEQVLPVTATLVYSTVMIVEATPTATPLNTPTAELSPVTENTPVITSTVVTATVPLAAPTPITPTAEATPCRPRPRRHPPCRRRRPPPCQPRLRRHSPR